MSIVLNENLYILLIDGVSESLLLSVDEERRIDPREVRARLDWWAIAFVRSDFDIPRPLLEHVLKCLLSRGLQTVIHIIINRIVIYTNRDCINYFAIEVIFDGISFTVLLRNIFNLLSCTIHNEKIRIRFKILSRVENMFTTQIL